MRRNLEEKLRLALIAEAPSLRCDWRLVRMDEVEHIMNKGNVDSQLQWDYADVMFYTRHGRCCFAGLTVEGRIFLTATSPDMLERLTPDVYAVFGSASEEFVRSAASDMADEALDRGLTVEFMPDMAIPMSFSVPGGSE